MAHPIINSRHSKSGIASASGRTDFELQLEALLFDGLELDDTSPFKTDTALEESASQVVVEELINDLVLERPSQPPPLARQDPARKRLRLVELRPAITRNEATRRIKPSRTFEVTRARARRIRLVLLTGALLGCFCAKVGGVLLIG